MKKLYIYLDSSSKSDTNKNNFLDLTVNLPFNLDLSECKWQIGLSEIFFSKKGGNWPNMYICCDGISRSFVKDKTLPVLRFIPDIYIYIENFDASSFLEETLYCTLHLKAAPTE